MKHTTTASTSLHSDRSLQEHQRQWPTICHRSTCEKAAADAAGRRRWSCSFPFRLLCFSDPPGHRAFLRAPKTQNIYPTVVTCYAEMRVRVRWSRHEWIQRFQHVEKASDPKGSQARQTLHQRHQGISLRNDGLKSLEPLKKANLGSLPLEVVDIR